MHVLQVPSSVLCLPKQQQQLSTIQSRLPTSLSTNTSILLLSSFLPKPYLLAILPNQLNVSNLISPSVATARRGKGGVVDDASLDVPEDDEYGSPSFVFPQNPCKACDAAPSMLILPPRDHTPNQLTGSSLRFLIVPRVYSMARESSG